MTIEYMIDHERRLVTVIPHGTLSLEEMLKYQGDVWRDPGLAGYDELVDMNEVTEVVADTIEHVRHLATVSTSMDAVIGSSRLAIVAPKDYHYGMARMYKVFREDDPQSTKRIEVFRTGAEALAWLRSGRGAGPAPL